MANTMPFFPCILNNRMRLSVPAGKLLAAVAGLSDRGTSSSFPCWARVTMASSFNLVRACHAHTLCFFTTLAIPEVPVVTREQLQSLTRAYLMEVIPIDDFRE